MTRTLTIPGEPVAKGRPRVTNRGITYTPPKTKNYETLVQELYWAKHQMLLNMPPTEKELLETTLNAYFAVKRVLNNPVALAQMKQVLESGVV